MTSLPLPPDSSSSSPSPSPSLPFRPFSRLPTELVQHIIEATGLSSYHSTTYVDRQTALLSLCLVSRLFRQIARPLLFAIVRIWKSNQFDSFCSQGVSNTVAKWTEQLILQGSLSSWRDRGLKPIAATYTGLRVFVVNHRHNGLDLAWLSSLNNLSDLSLSQVEIDYSTPFVMQSVVQLEVISVDSAVPYQNIFNPATFPSLRAFTVGRHPHRQLPEAIVPLIPQLDALFLDVGVAERFPDDVAKQLKRKTLFNHSNVYRFESMPSVEYLRIEAERELDFDELYSVADVIRAAVAPLPSVLYLPAHLSSDSPLDPLDSAACEVLYQACDLHKIKVVYEATPNEWTLRSGISKDFWRRMREAKVQEGNV